MFHLQNLFSFCSRWAFVLTPLREVFMTQCDNSLIAGAARLDICVTAIAKPHMLGNMALSLNSGQNGC